MIEYLKKHKESLIVIMLGLVIFSALNIMMVQYHEDLWTKIRTGYWNVFCNNFEVSGFDAYTYMVISLWRPLYVISRHPLLALMIWPLSELNAVMGDIWGLNFSIYIVAVMLTIISTCSWWLMYKIMRKIIELEFLPSIILTAFFFSFSHVLLITFVEDHMAFTLPLLLLAIYLGGKAIKEKKKMSLWYSLPLLFISTGVTTTNCVKIGIADLMTRWKKQSFMKLVLHFCIYLIPLGIIFGLYELQLNTTQAEEGKTTKHIIESRSKRDSTFAANWKKYEQFVEDNRKQQLVQLDFVTNTDYKIDRLPSLVENIFGEGIILHDDYILKDANKPDHRPVLVRYDSWIYYAIEAVIVALFIAGIWFGRKQRLLWMVMGMFLFDMLLHVGLNFASADVYIMTAHWAFVIPIAIAYMVKKASENSKAYLAAVSTVLFLTTFLLSHNLPIIIDHIL